MRPGRRSTPGRSRRAVQDDALDPRRLRIALTCERARLCSPATTSSTRRPVGGGPADIARLAELAATACCSSRRLHQRRSPGLVSVGVAASARRCTRSSEARAGSSSPVRVEHPPGAAGADAAAAGPGGGLRAAPCENNIGRRLGHVKVPEVFSSTRCEDYPEEKVVIVSAGSQGEPLSALRAWPSDTQVDASRRRHRGPVGHADPG